MGVMAKLSTDRCDAESMNTKTPVPIPQTNILFEGIDVGSVRRFCVLVFCDGFYSSSVFVMPEARIHAMRCFARVPYAR